MGIYPAYILKKLEKEIAGKSKSNIRELDDLFSLCSGTSTGAIISGFVATGVPADKIYNFYYTDGYELFTKTAVNRFPAYPFWCHKFKRAVFQKKLFNILGTESDYSKRHPNGTVAMKNLNKAPLLIIPAFDLVGQRTLYINSSNIDESGVKRNGDVLVGDAISASALSAALYFGKYPAPSYEWQFQLPSGIKGWRKGAVFNDGGQGTQNSPLLETLFACIEEGWLSLPNDNEQLVIISIGTGTQYKLNDYHKIKNISGLAQLKAFLGNQARSESQIIQQRALEEIANKYDNIKFYRFDWHDKGKKGSPFSITNKQRALYIKEAKKTCDSPEFTELVSFIKGLTNLVKR